MTTFILAYSSVIFVTGLLVAYVASRECLGNFFRETDIGSDLSQSFLNLGDRVRRQHKAAWSWIHQLGGEPLPEAAFEAPPISTVFKLLVILDLANRVPITWAQITVSHINCGVLRLLGVTRTGVADHKESEGPSDGPTMEDDGNSHRS